MADPVELTGAFQLDGTLVVKRVTVSVAHNAPVDFEEFAEAVFDANGLGNNCYSKEYFQWDGKTYDNILDILRDFPEFFTLDDKSIDLSTIIDVVSLHFGSFSLDV